MRLIVFTYLLGIIQFSFSQDTLEVPDKMIGVALKQEGNKEIVDTIFEEGTYIHQDNFIRIILYSLEEQNVNDVFYTKLEGIGEVYVYIEYSYMLKRDKLFYIIEVCYPNN